MADTLLRSGPSSKVSDRGQEASLGFRRLGFERGISWVEVRPGTGRHHQIRVQFAHRGHPVLGDFRYGSRIGFPKKSLALHARMLTLLHSDPEGGDDVQRGARGVLAVEISVA